MDSGNGSGVEVVYSQSETVGLPNYSNVNVLVSSKGSVQIGSEGVGYDHLHAVLNQFLYERIVRIVKALSISAAHGVVVDERDPVEGGAPHEHPEQLFYTPIETVFSMSEQIGLPEYSNAKLMASAKALWNVSNLREGLDYLSQTVSAQMGQKRSMVLANPRPWIISKA